MKKTSLKIESIAFILLLFFIIDRTTKYLALNKLYEKGVYFFKYFQFQLQTNSGIAFGIPLPIFLITALTTIIIFFIFFCLFKSIKKKRYLDTFLLGLITIGAISNLLDRILYKEVVDFILVGFWPNFNLADAYISIGVILFLIISIKKDPEENIPRAL